jgi:hypothetical protein
MQRNQDWVRNPAAESAAGLHSPYKWIPASCILTPEARMAVLGIDLHKHESQVAVLPNEPSSSRPVLTHFTAGRTIRGFRTRSRFGYAAPAPSNDSVAVSQRWYG